MVAVLNSGYVQLLESMGGDAAVIRNARRCWRSESSGEDADRKLIRHLLRQGHKSPFEAAVFTYDVKTPLFVARQWFRHRMASYNEESLRYCTALREYYIPDSLHEEQRQLWVDQQEKAFDAYETLVESGMRKEQARSVLPLGTYTRFFWTVNGSSLMNFLMLRLDRHAQWEIQQFAQAIFALARKEAPVIMDEFDAIVVRPHESS